MEFYRDSMSTWETERVIPKEKNVSLSRGQGRGIGAEGRGSIGSCM